jgi:outer membrane protein assembly factor BamB
MIPTDKGIIIEADSGTTYLVDAYSDKVLYDKILSDYKVDKGHSVDKIYPLSQDNSKATQKSTEPLATKQKDSKKANKKGVDVNVVLGDFKGKPS